MCYKYLLLLLVGSIQSLSASESGRIECIDNNDSHITYFNPATKEFAEKIFLLGEIYQAGKIDKHQNRVITQKQPVAHALFDHFEALYKAQTEAAAGAQSVKILKK